MHYLVMMDLGDGVQPDDEGAVRKRANQLLAPYDETTKAPPWKRYHELPGLWAQVEIAIDASLLDRRWDSEARPAPNIESATIAETSALWGAADAWRQMIVERYSPAETAMALNHHYQRTPVASSHAADHQDDEAYYADRAGLYQWVTSIPDGKFDWWSVGKRRNPFFKVKPPQSGPSMRRDVARMGDIDWVAIQRERRVTGVRQWDEWRNSTGRNKDLLARSYGIGESTSLAAYLDAIGPLIITRAFVDGTGNWQEGAPGWDILAGPDPAYGAMFAAWLQSIPDDHVLAIADCHV